jgi:hypothetical protein
MAHTARRHSDRKERRSPAIRTRKPSEADTMTVRRRNTSAAASATRTQMGGRSGPLVERIRGYLPVYRTCQIEFVPSSLTIRVPSGATATPTGRPQTCPSGVTNPVTKS